MESKTNKLILFTEDPSRNPGTQVGAAFVEKAPCFPWSNRSISTGSVLRREHNYGPRGARIGLKRLAPNLAVW